jgi:DNA-binding NtrC family response regulator
VASAPGEGTTFTINFPRVDAEIGPHEQSDGRWTTGELPTGHETILLVEDNDALRRLAKRVLTDLGYVTLVASNAEEALLLSRARREPIHLLLTDIVMPGADGVTLSRRLAIQHPDTRVLFMSGYSRHDLAERYAQTDRMKRLQKPLTRVTLACAVREALDADVVKPAVRS